MVRQEEAQVILQLKGRLDPLSPLAVQCLDGSATFFPTAEPSRQTSLLPWVLALLLEVTISLTGSASYLPVTRVAVGSNPASSSTGDEVLRKHIIGDEWC